MNHKPIKTRALAYQMAIQDMAKIIQLTLDKFEASPPEVQGRLLRRIVPPEEAAAPNEQSYQNTTIALVRLIFPQVVQIYQRRIETGILRACLKQGMGEEFETVLKKAKQGDRKALLKIISVFPDAEHDDPVRMLVKQALEEDSTFMKAWRKLSRKPRVHGHMKNHLAMLMALCLRIDLVKAHAAGRMTLQGIIDELDRLGIRTQENPGTFSTWLHRNFPDMYPPK